MDADLVGHVVHVVIAVISAAGAVMSALILRNGRKHK